MTSRLTQPKLRFNETVEVSDKTEKKLKKSLPGKGEYNNNFLGDFMEGVTYGKYYGKKEYTRSNFNSPWKKGDFNFERRDLQRELLVFLFEYINKKRMWRRLETIKCDIDPSLMKWGMTCMESVNESWPKFVWDYRLGLIN